jgi:8-oxo-dGTP diphosphatase
MTDSQLPPGVQRLIGPDGVLQRVRPAVYAWCERDGAVVLCRVASRGPGAGRWTLPGGGLRFGEDPLAALTREFEEETGLTVAPGDLLGVRSAVVEPAETVSGHRIQTLGILYRGTVLGGQLRDEAAGSTDQARWIDLHEVESLPLTALARWALSLAPRLSGR